MHKEDTKVFVFKVAILAFIVRMAIGIAYYNIFISDLKRPLYAFDGEFFSIMGWYIALVLKGINVLQLPSVFVPNDYTAIGGLFIIIADFHGNLPNIMLQYGVGLYAYLIGIFYYIFGYAPVLLRCFHSGLAVASAFIVYDIAKGFFSETVARVSFVMTLFMPLALVYSASLQRDTLVNFVILSAVWGILNVRRDGWARSIAALAVSAISLILLYFLRVHAFLVLAVFVASYLYVKALYAFRFATAGLTALAAAVPQAWSTALHFMESKITLMLTYHLQLSYLGGFTFRILPERYYKFEEMVSAYFRPAISWPDMAAGYLSGLKTFFLEPSPLSIYKVRHLLAMPEMAIWYLVVLFAAFGVYGMLKSLTAEKAALLLLAVLFASAIGLSEANAETLMRHRYMVTPIFIIFAARGMEVVRAMASGEGDIKR